MRLWIASAVLLLVAAATALGWHWLAADPGYILLRMRGISVETSVLFALVATVLIAVSILLAARLLRWPARGAARIRLRRQQRLLGKGLVDLDEGRYLQAERRLTKAARTPETHGPALLAAARAAQARGDEGRAAQLLGDADNGCHPATIVLRARFLMEDGNSAQALQLLKTEVEHNHLPPAAWPILIEAALQQGDLATALAALAPLARSNLLPGPEHDALELRVMAAALATARDAAQLRRRWMRLPRARRREPRLISAFAQRAAALGEMLPAMDAIQSALKKQWDDSLARVYGELGPTQISTRTRTAESWLDDHPDSQGLLLGLGRMCVQQSLWAKGEQYLRRALAIADSATAWELLGDCLRGDGDSKGACLCYVNALRIARADGVAQLAATDAGDSREQLDSSPPEARNQHGWPQLPSP